MSSSPIPKPETIVMIGLGWTCLRTWELSAASQESFTKMEEFISMYSQISDGSFRHERLMFSMWEASTLTSNQLGELRARLSTTSARMEILSQAGYHDRAETQIGILIRSGIQRQINNLLKSFCTFAINWLHEISYEDSPISEPMQHGNLLNDLNRTVHPQALSLTRQELREWQNGSIRLIWGLEQLDRGEC